MVTQITQYFSAQHLFDIAKRASSRKFRDPPTIAVVFSVTALEAFINESIALAKMIPTTEKQGIVTAYATAMSELEDRRESLAVKYHIGLIIWSGSTWSDELQSYQDFRLLVTLRNALLHMRADRWEVQLDPGLRAPERGIDQYPKFIRTLQQRRLIALPSKSKSWLEIVNTPEIGKWACSTAADITKLFADRVPDGCYKQELEKHALRYT
jgi:hypothetical protein